MKKQVISFIMVTVLSVGGCLAGNNVSPQQKQEVITEGIRFCESTYPYENGLLIANFGATELNPLNNEGKGYILYYKDGKTETLIPADGHLSAPKGMYQKDGYLFVCDVNKLAVYNLKALKQAPQIISFPADDLFLNDLAAHGNTLYISVTNSGRIYTLDISQPSQLNQGTLKKWLDITGPNGIIIDGNAMYVASYPADGNTTEKNVIYKIADLSRPMAEKFFNIAGQYDGIALSADKKTLYISNWAPASVTAVDMKTKKTTVLPLDKELVGPADMTLRNGTLYIPDLPNSRVLVYKLK